MGLSPTTSEYDEAVSWFHDYPSDELNAFTRSVVTGEICSGGDHVPAIRSSSPRRALRRLSAL